MVVVVVVLVLVVVVVIFVTNTIGIQCDKVSFAIFTFSDSSSVNFLY